MKNNDSKALLEVWEWKQKAYTEIADLDIRSALKKRILSSTLNSEIMGYKTVTLVTK